MSQPLSGICVLDFSTLLPGPLATLLLAEAGAEVIKIERPGSGDEMRSYQPKFGASSVNFALLNRGKRSVAIDLKAADAVSRLRPLIQRADVVVEQFRPGVMDRLGIGYAALSAENPGVVLCSISGYGQDGPYRDRAGHDIDYCAVAGVLALNGPAERPFPLGVQVADLAGGSWPAVAGILAALVRRAATGEGAHVDVSMTEGALSMLTLQQGAADARGTPLRRGGEQLNGGSACYGVYRTRDGRFVALGALEPKFFARFCQAVGRPELAERQFDADGAGPVREVEEIFAGRSFAEWSRFAAEHDVCVAPVLEGDEPRGDPQLAARGAFVAVDTPWEGRAMASLATPVRFASVEPPRRPAPELGADGEAVLAEAGFPAEEIAGLRDGGVI